MVVKETPNWHPSGISALGRILNCQGKLQLGDIGGFPPGILTSFRYWAIDSILAFDGISSQYSNEAVGETQASSPCFSASFIICP